MILHGVNEATIGQVPLFRRSPESLFSSDGLFAALPGSVGCRPGRANSIYSLSIIAHGFGMSTINLR